MRAAGHPSLLVLSATEWPPPALHNFGATATRPARASPPSAYSLIESQIEKGTHFGATKSGAFRDSDTAPRNRRQSTAYETTAALRTGPPNDACCIWTLSSTMY